MNPSRMVLNPLFLAVTLALSAQAGLAAETGNTRKATKLDTTEVNATAAADPRFPAIAREIEDGRVQTGKKSTEIRLDEQAPVVNNALRETLIRLPGLLLSEQQIPGHFNVNYRGLGDPHESEFVSFLENGVPIASDWFGYPTLYYLPSMERVRKVTFLRGGSGLLYGPQVGPSVNFQMRAPAMDEHFEARTRHVGGADGLYATYNELSGGQGDLGWLVALDRRQFDGERDNEDSEVTGLNATLNWRQGDTGTWRLDLSGYDSESGEAGRMPNSFYEADPLLTTQPFNRLWIERRQLTLGTEQSISDLFRINATAWYATQDRYSRRTPRFLPGNLTPNLLASFDRQEFESFGVDARATLDWGDNHTITFGSTGYVDDSPREQRTSTVLIAPSGETLRFAQERETEYLAVFAENVFRFDRWSVIPALRVERLTLGIDETLRAPGLRRDAIDDRFTQTVPLLGLGLTHDWHEQGLQFYANASQAYRPMRFDDVGNPTANLGLGNDPDVADALNLEAGLRGQPVAGLFFDVSVFQIDFEDKLENFIVPGTTDIERVNSGDARHRGLELAGEYDFLHDDGDQSLKLHGSVALLDARITASQTASLVGKTPSYAPDHVVKLGLQYDWQQRLKIGLTGTLVDEHYWQDSNQGTGTGVFAIAAEIPAYQVFDLSAEYRLLPNLSLLGGISNLADKQYYSRVRSDGLEPAAGRRGHLGFEFRFD
ncbi:MAG: TonB-dependent receptor [Ahniella sp.]|nr:TonB-dependent receptor [Ahniella sp.]